MFQELIDSQRDVHSKTIVAYTTYNTLQYCTGEQEVRPFKGEIRGVEVQSQVKRQRTAAGLGEMRPEDQAFFLEVVRQSQGQKASSGLGAILGSVGTTSIVLGGLYELYWKKKVKDSIEQDIKGEKSELVFKVGRLEAENTALKNRLQDVQDVFGTVDPNDFKKLKAKVFKLDGNVEAKDKEDGGKELKDYTIDLKKLQKYIEDLCMIKPIVVLRAEQKQVDEKKKFRVKSTDDLKKIIETMRGTYIFPFNFVQQWTNEFNGVKDQCTTLHALIKHSNTFKEQKDLWSRESEEDSST